MPDHLLTWIQVGALLLSTIVTVLAATGRLGFATGRAVQLRDADAKDIARLDRQLEEKADCDRVTSLEARVSGEHAERRRLVDDINVKLGSVQIEQRGQVERLRSLEEDVRELRRRIFNGGIAGV